MATTSVLGDTEAMLGNFQLGAIGTVVVEKPDRSGKHRHRPRPQTLDRPLFLGYQYRRGD